MLSKANISFIVVATCSGLLVSSLALSAALPALNSVDRPAIQLKPAASTTTLPTPSLRTSMRPVSTQLVATNSSVAADLAVIIRIMHDQAPANAVEQEAVASFYSNRDYQPLWLSDAGLTTRGSALLAVLREMQQLGVQQPALLQFVATVESREINLAAAEFELSWRLLSLGRLLTRNLSEPAVNFDNELYANQVIMAEIGAFDEPAQLIRSWEPRHPDYAGLKYSLRRYELLAAKPWPLVTGRRLLKPGQAGTEFVALRQRLKAEGYPLPKADTPAYSNELVAQVQEFQRRHGLPAKGIVGRSTRSALNVPATKRLAQIRHSMARLFALPNNLGESYVWVNIPAFEMAVYAHQQPVLAMNVVVGKPRHATPEMVDVMESIEFNPYWNVPVSISRAEMIPSVSKDPTWLARNNIEVLNWHNGRRYRGAVDWATVAQEKQLPFRLRQKPGRKNALGQVKFLFPNRHAVYMHDTPAKSLFSRTKRAFSHGCVRLAEPLKLAEYVLENHVNRGVDIAGTLRSGRNTPVPLDTPLPVYLSYSTAWMDSENRLHLSADLYRKDHRFPVPMTQIFDQQYKQFRRLQLALKAGTAGTEGRLAALDR